MSIIIGLHAVLIRLFATIDIHYDRRYILWSDSGHLRAWSFLSIR
jgi:hypothetical protein